jgi:hypothetical protein
MDSDRTVDPILNHASEAIASFLQESEPSSASLLFALIEDFSTTKKEKQFCLLLERFLQPIASLRPQDTHDNRSLRLRHIQLQAYLRIWLYCCDDADGTFKKRYAKWLATEKKKKRRKIMASSLSDALLMADVHSILTLAAFCLPREQSMSSFLHQKILQPLVENCPSARQVTMQATIQRIFDKFEIPVLVTHACAIVPVEQTSVQPLQSTLRAVRQRGTGVTGLCSTVTDQPPSKLALKGPSRKVTAQKEPASYSRIGLGTKRLIDHGSRSRRVGGRFHSNTSKKWIRQVKDLMTSDQRSHSARGTCAATVQRFVGRREALQGGVLQTVHNHRWVEGPRRPALGTTEETTPKKRPAKGAVLETPVRIKKADRSIRQNEATTRLEHKFTGPLSLLSMAPAS